MFDNPNITDLERLKFLQKLHTSDLEVSDWERRFIASLRMSPRPSLWFTQARRVAADKMRNKYGNEPEIKMPYPLMDGMAPVMTPADPTGCEFIVTEEGRPRRCNDEATCKRQSGFRYCDRHKDQVLTHLKRGGKTMALYPLNV